VNETTITIIGNLTADPELRFTPSGVAVASFTIASTPRTFDKATNEWKDGETLFMRCSIWREAAENVAESLTRGTRVIVTGRLKSRSYEKDGQQRTAYELDVEEVGPSLKYATAKVAKVERGQRTPDRAQGDAWATTPAMRAESAQQAASAGWGNQSSYDEPPF
jgi:single-strand DNA-binding protein